MQLVEKYIYFLKVGLFCFTYNEVNNGLFGNGSMATKGCPISFDHRTDDGFNIFTLLENHQWYIRVNDEFLEYEITYDSSIAINIDDKDDIDFLLCVEDHNSKIMAALQ